MTREQIIQMAKNAGIAKHGLGWTCWEGQLERFAALVAAAEREALEQVAERELANTSALMSMPPKSSAAWNILQAIRARGKA
jgi:hypothetical protein